MVQQIPTSYKTHALIGFLLGFWLVLFLIVIAPFDVEDLTLKNRLILMPLYGLITFGSYVILIPIQNQIFLKTKKWSWINETVFILVFNLLALFGSYWYYQSNILRGLYSFSRFTLEIYYPTFFLLVAFVVIFRWFVFKGRQTDEGTILIRGENRLDTLQVPFSELVSVSSADNYVEVNYLQDGILLKKLLRATLKGIEKDIPKLIRVHRSHLINKAHFTEWKDSSTIIAKGLEVPVSKSYKSKLIQQKSRP